MANVKFMKITSQHSLRMQTLQNVKYDNVAQFLPPGFKVNSEEQTTTRKTTTTKDPTTTTSSGIPKLGLANLFGDIKTDDLSGLLPPGFNPDKIKEEEEVTSTKSVTTSTSTGWCAKRYYTRGDTADCTRTRI